MSQPEECGSWLDAVLDGRTDIITAIGAWMNGECPNGHPDVMPEETDD